MRCNLLVEVNENHYCKATRLLLTPDYMKNGDCYYSGKCNIQKCKLDLENFKTKKSLPNDNCKRSYCDNCKFSDGYCKYKRGVINEVD